MKIKNPHRRSRAASARTQPIQPELLRARDVAAYLGFGLTQIEMWRRDGTLRAIPIPGLRSVRYAREEVERVKRRWVNGEATDTP